MALGNEIDISGAVVNLNADGALGDAATTSVKVDLTNSKLNFNGVTVNRSFRNSGAGKFFNAVTVKAGTANVINGDLDISESSTASEGSIVLGKNSSLTINGHLTRNARTCWVTIAPPNDRGNRARLDLNKCMLMDNGSAIMIWNSGLDLYLNAPSNQFGSVWFWYAGGGKTLHTTVPYACSKFGGKWQSIIKFGNSDSVWDLHGCDQELFQMQAGSPFRITSEKGALLHLATDNARQSDSITNSVAFEGGAGVSFDGSYFNCLTGASSSTGTVQVTKGELKLFAGATWPNASAAVVKGGRLSVARSDAFGANTRYDLASAGKLDLAAGVRLKTRRAPVFDGVEATERGTYGSTASNAEFKDDRHFAGKGVLKFFPKEGTVVILR